MKYFTVFIKYIFLPASLSWMIAQLLSVHIPNNFIINFVSGLTGIPASDLLLKPFVDQGFNSIDTFLYGPIVYTGLAFLSFTSIILGFFVLGRGRLWFEKLLLLQAFAIPRERINWGKVYNRANNMPVPFATIRLLHRKDGKDTILVSTISDMDGRYRMYVNLSEGEYLISIKASGYEDVLISVEKTYKAQNIMINIALQQSSNTLVSKKASLPTVTKATLYNTLIIYVYIASIVTFLHIGYSIFYHFGLISILNLIFYGFAAPWNTYVLIRRNMEKPGRIIDSYNDLPIQFVQIQIFKNGKSVGSAISNALGVVQFDVEQGMYSLEIGKPGYMAVSNSHVDNVTINLLGFLDHNLFMTPTQTDSSATNSLPNPFGA